MIFEECTTLNCLTLCNDENMNFSYLKRAEWRNTWNATKIITFKDAAVQQLRKENLRKIQAFRDSNPDLCDTGAAL